MFEKNKAKTIGKVHIKDFDALQIWLSSNEGMHYIDNNWSKPRNKMYANNWQDGVNIGFYDLQNTIPFLDRSKYHYEKIQDKTFGTTHLKTLLNELKEYEEYYAIYNQSFDLIYDGGSYAVFCSQNDVYLFPTHLLEIEKFKNYDEISIHELKSLSGPKDEMGLIPKGTDISVNRVKEELEKKQSAIEKAKDELENLEEEKRKELEKFKKELEAAYKDKFELLQRKQKELQLKQQELEQQIFLLDTEIYAIRSYNGETIQFTKITNGKRVDDKTPFVLYQKIRYLDVELGKHLAVYNFSGTTKEIKYFEDILRYREDIRNLLLPTEKCCTLFRISQSSKSYVAHDSIANILQACDKFHGHTLGILIRNGEETYIAWTDEERVSISNGNAFMNGERKVEILDEETCVQSSSKEDVASRYFLYATLQGVIDNQNIVGIPKNSSILKPTPYIILSMADGWIEDNRFGTFEDIVNKTSRPFHVGDMVLTTMRITRDDIHSGYFGGRSTVYDSYNNERGRGEKNRTHDVSLKNCTLYPINCIDKTDTYEITEKWHPLDVEVVEHIKQNNSCTNTSFSYKTKRSNKEAEIHTQLRYIENNTYANINIKGMTPDEAMRKLNDNIYCLKEYYDHEQIEHKHAKEVTGYIPEYVSAKIIETTYDYFISEEKTGNRWYTKKTARANMQIYEDECLNLTFLNSVWIIYAIQNQKMGRWKVGGNYIDYATSVKYLNKALKYLKEREKEEAALISKYMELPNEWQVALSEWKLENNIHKLTDTRAKRFSKTFNK